MPKCRTNVQVWRRNAGFTYAGLLFAIVVLGMALATTGTLWSTVARRDREAQLLWTGHQFREAIASYVLSSPAGVRQYPQALQDLLEDRRGPIVKRHLRRVYPDPMTGEADWQLERLGDGAVVGVRSASLGIPLKRQGFSPEDVQFEEAGCYCDWVFSFRPVPVAVAVQ